MAPNIDDPAATHREDSQQPMSRQESLEIDITGSGKLHNAKLAFSQRRTILLRS